MKKALLMILAIPLVGCGHYKNEYQLPDGRKAETTLPIRWE